MELKYVGDMPLVSRTGVGFDKTQPDKYQYIYASIELLEALSYGETEVTQHLYRAPDKELKPQELLEMIKKYVPNIDEVFESCDAKAHDLVHDLVNRVKDNDSLSDDGRTAWLENIKIMRAYYYQYVINQNAYEAALEVLGDEIHDGHIKEIRVPMFKNYGAVLTDLVGVLEKRKVPIDSEMIIEQRDEGIVGILFITHN